uniref:Uncharacterized protein n=1 Tax=Romanomermis culicivorax TaxID=13658 RepID=A0A915IV11_ROMCU
MEDENPQHDNSSFDSPEEGCVKSFLKHGIHANATLENKFRIFVERTKQPIVLWQIGFPFPIHIANNKVFSNLYCRPGGNSTIIAVKG